MSAQKKDKCGNGWEVSVARTFDEVEAVRPDWEKMQAKEPFPVINADINRYLSVLKASGDDVKPYVLLFRQQDEPKTMVIGRLEKYQLKCKIGYKVICNPSLRCLTIVYGGILGQREPTTCILIVKELLFALRRREADMVFFNQLRIDSPIYRAARTIPTLCCRGYFHQVLTHWTMTVPDEMEQFYQACSPKHRKHLRQYVRKLKRTYPGQVKMITYSKEDELDEAIKAASEISAKTYQHAMNKGIVNDSFTRNLMKTAARQGWLRAHILYIDDEPSTYRFALYYGRTYFADGIGFDPKWSKWRVGTILFLEVLENLCRDGAVDYYDFGFGDAEYKQHYADKSWPEASVYIFAPRLYPVLVNLADSSTRGLSLGAHWLTDRTGSARWLKRHWRDRLQWKNRKKEK